MAKIFRSANSYFLPFFILYMIGIFAKIFFFFWSDAAVYQGVFIVTCIEVVLWLLISWRFYPKGGGQGGVILLYSAMTIYVLIPFAMLAYGLGIFPFPDAAVRAAMVGQSLALSNLYLFLHCMISPKLIKACDVHVNNWILSFKHREKNLILVLSFGIFLAFIYLYNFHMSGVSDIVGSESRIVVAKKFETGKAWLLQYAFISWLMATTTIVFFANKISSISILNRVLLLSAVAIFSYPYLLVGNRREIAIFLVFLIILSMYRGRKIVLMLAAISFPALLTVGLTRSLQGQSVGELDLETNLINLFGEFVFPHYSLIYYSSLPGHEFQLGQSFFMLPVYAAPSFGLWEKVNSLSIQFASDYANLDMGYALTPLAEGYINFGWASIVAAPFLLVSTIRMVLKYGRKAPYGVLVLLSLPLDISRGEFTTIAFQWIIFTAIFALIVWMYKFSFSRGVD